MRSSQCDGVSLSVPQSPYHTQMQVYQKVPESEKRAQSWQPLSMDRKFCTGSTSLGESCPFIVYSCYRDRLTAIAFSLSVSKDGFQMFALNRGGLQAVFHSIRVADKGLTILFLIYIFNAIP